MLRIDVLTDLKQIDALGKKLDNEELVKRIALIAEQVFVDESPVDTGLLRANWFVTTDGSDNRTFNRKQHSPSNVPIPQPELFVLNNINYAVYANLTSYRKMYIERSLNIIRNEIERINLDRL